MSIGTLDGGLPAGRGYVHGARNYYCRECGAYTTVGPNEPDPKRCATPGCQRPYGFGRHVPVEAPVRSRR
ncbi:MAG: hypothetical protein AMXMBFR36_27950 [Acidobacteriota bacterium]